MRPDPKEWTDAEILRLKTQAATMVAERPEQQMAVSIVRTLGKNLSDDDWIGMYRGVQPSIVPLTPRQLEALRGGLDLSGLLFPFPMPGPGWPNPIEW